MLRSVLFYSGRASLLLSQQLQKQAVQSTGNALGVPLKGVAIYAKGVHGRGVANQILYHAGGQGLGGGNKGVPQAVGCNHRQIIVPAVAGQVFAVVLLGHAIEKVGGGRRLFLQVPAVLCRCV